MQHIPQYGIGITGCDHISLIYLQTTRHFLMIELLVMTDLNDSFGLQNAGTYRLPFCSILIDALLVIFNIQLMMNALLPEQYSGLNKTMLNAKKQVCEKNTRITYSRSAFSTHFSQRNLTKT